MAIKGGTTDRRIRIAAIWVFVETLDGIEQISLRYLKIYCKKFFAPFLTSAHV
jgi:hypothetical protein